MGGLMMLPTTFLLSLFFPNIFGPSLLPSGGQAEELIPTNQGLPWKKNALQFFNKQKNRSCLWSPIRGSPFIEKGPKNEELKTKKKGAHKEAPF
jgi:hypothetical protein